MRKDHIKDNDMPGSHGLREDDLMGRVVTVTNEASAIVQSHILHASSLNPLYLLSIHPAMGLKQQH